MANDKFNEDTPDLKTEDAAEPITGDTAENAAEPVTSEGLDRMLQDLDTEIAALDRDADTAEIPEAQSEVTTEVSSMASMLDAVRRKRSKEDAKDSAKRKKKKKRRKKSADAPIDDENFDGYDPNEDYIFFRPRKARKKRRRRKSRKLSCALVLVTLILAVATLLSVTILTVAMEIYGINKSTDQKVITIPAGATTSDIAEQLQTEHMIRIPKLFRLISRLNGNDGKYIAGEHILSPSMSYQTMIAELCKNHQSDREYVTVTLPEGITLLQAAEILEKNEVCDADDFLFYFNAGGFGFSFENYLPTEANVLKFHQREGYCFPDTYDFYINEQPQIVAQKIYANFDKKLTEGDYRKMEELNMTLDEVITLASIVQAETATNTDMKKIASVFHNRLLNRVLFPSLQSDPTRKYAENVIHPNLPVTNQLMEDAYNTYVGQGLPPGAINSPGKEAINAVLYPASTSYYFFAANVDTGVTYYATTNEEHEANLKKIKQEQAAAAAAAQGQ